MGLDDLPLQPEYGYPARPGVIGVNVFAVSAHAKIVSPFTRSVTSITVYGSAASYPAWKESTERTAISRKRKFTRWPPHTDATGTYDLHRVYPFNFIHQLPQTALYPARSIQIRVGFSHHTFTDPKPSLGIVTIELESRDAGVLVANGEEMAAAEQQVVVAEQISVQTAHYEGSPSACRDIRFFSIERYELAKQLRDIVEHRLPSRTCYFAKSENYFVVEANSTPSKEYRVFFDVRHIEGASDSVLLYVQSAYLADRSTAPGGKRKKVGFNVLVNCALKATRAVETP